MKNKILLTGASGFIGSHLLRTLAKKNSFIYAVHHKNKEKLINDRIKLINCDLTNFKQTQELFKKYKFNIIG